jgi:hypothetical protein
VRFWLLGLAVVLAAHLLSVLGASLVVAAVGRSARARLARLAPAARASRLLFLALLPAAAGLLCVGLVVPAWLLYEPRTTSESPGPALLALALAGLVLVVARAASGAADALQTRRLVTLFRREGREIGGLPMPASRAAHAFPVAAIAGLWRPRLLFADCVLSALGPEELDAVVAHELAHRSARDNLKRLLLRASPDPLALTAAGRRLRADFLEAAEAAADARACARVAPTVLARAILKVARLVPTQGRLELSLASFHREGSVATRVRALLDSSAPPQRASTDRPRPGRRIALGLLLGIGLASAIAALALVHQGLERLVRLLA